MDVIVDVTVVVKILSYDFDGGVAVFVVVVLVVVDFIVVVVDVNVVRSANFEAKPSFSCKATVAEISLQSVVADLLKTKAYETIKTASNINKLDTK